MEFCEGCESDKITKANERRREGERGGGRKD